MSGFFRMESDAWESLLALVPRPLSREHAAMDLRHLADRVRLHEGGRLPDHAELAVRWGWMSHTGQPAVKRVRLLKADEDAWKDPYRRASEEKGQAEGRARAGEGQAEGRARAGQERANLDQSSEKGRARAGEGQAEGRARAGEGPHARSRPPSPTPSPTPVEQDPPVATGGPVLVHPVEPPAKPDDWSLLADHYAALPWTRRPTDRKVGNGKALAKILRAAGSLADAKTLIDWWARADDDRAIFLRDGKGDTDRKPGAPPVYGLDTLATRPEGYMERAIGWRARGSPPERGRGHHGAGYTPRQAPPSDDEPDIDF